MEEQSDRRISKLQGNRRAHNCNNDPPRVSVSDQAAGRRTRRDERWEWDNNKHTKAKESTESAGHNAGHYNRYHVEPQPYYPQVSAIRESGFFTIPQRTFFGSGAAIKTLYPRGGVIIGRGPAIQQTAARVLPSAKSPPN
jgi:hypothetical protein